MHKDKFEEQFIFWELKKREFKKIFYCLHKKDQNFLNYPILHNIQYCY